MRWRVATTVGCAVVLGVVAYASKQGGWIFSAPPRGIGVAAAIGILVLPFAVGAVVRRWWVLLAVLGPLAALAYLEVTGFVGMSGDWAAEPLLSPPGLFFLVFFAVLLTFGKCLTEIVIAELATRRRERAAGTAGPRRL